MGLIKVVNDYDQPDLVPFCKPYLHCTSGREKQGVTVFHLSHPGPEEKAFACQGHSGTRQ